MSKKTTDSWILATRLCEAYIKRPGKANFLLEKLPCSLPPSHRRRCQFLFLGVIRNLSRISSAISVLVKKEPRPRLKSILYVGAVELLTSEDEKAALIINNAVEQAKLALSQSEARLVNAVLRKALPLLKNPHGIAEPAELSVRLALLYSHPEWLVRKWLLAFGPVVVEELLRWNQEPPPIYIYQPPKNATEPIDGLKLTKWPGFYQIVPEESGNIGELVEKHRAIVMDPASARPVELLDVRGDEKVLDLCAAPGGKSSFLAGLLEKQGGLLVALDKPGPRVQRLRENLSRFLKARSHIVEADLLQTTPEALVAKDLPGQYDAVLLDAPCSNTGVFRRRPDARWRLQPADIAAAASRQVELLKKASAFVSPKGRLVYSTCSLEEEENKLVVDKFLRLDKGFWRLKAEISCNPWDDDHDGGSAFLLVPAGNRRQN